MKIAIIRKKYTFHGGAEGFSQALTRILSEAGHSVDIYAAGWEGFPEDSGVRIIRVPTLSFNSFFRDLTFAVSTFLMLRRSGYDIIQSHDKTLYQDIYRAGDGCHREWLKQKMKRTGLIGRLSVVLNPYHWLILILERLIFRGRRYKKVLAISKMVKKNIIDNYSVHPGDIEVIYNGVDLERFNPKNRALYRSAVRSEYGIGEQDLVLLFVGSGFERKGLGSLISAAEELDFPATVLVAGRGRERPYRNLAKRRKVIFCGPRKDIERYYAASDIFVFPTIYEPFGNVHLEALASGLPVITTSQSGAAELIEDGSEGYVVSVPEDYRSIARCITRLSDHQARAAASVKARVLAEKFSLGKHMEETLRLYEKLFKK